MRLNSAWAFQSPSAVMPASTKGWSPGTEPADDIKLVRIKGIRLERTRDFGDVWLALGLWRLVGLDELLSSLMPAGREEVRWEQVAAILTIAGYSINDTVVVYDRVRENMRRYKRTSYEELFNQSINQTLSRTVVTSVTTLLALFALFLFGGEVIRGFSIALIWGVAIGTYSSIALAVPFLLYIRPPRGSEEEGDEAAKQASS